MIIYPAIDLRNGRCVRLRQGDPTAETVFGEDPAAMARHWADQGAQWLHVVNLDGALDATSDHLHALHRPKTILIQHPDAERAETPHEELMRRLPVNVRRLAEIRQAVDIPIQFGGGMRTMDDIQLALELGADRVILGTAAVENPALVREAIEQWGPERIVVGIDARDDKVATHGWQETSELDAIELGHRMHALGVRLVVYTDISRDGMLSGVNTAMTSRLGDVTGLEVIASGGVASMDDIHTLKRYEFYNIEGVITGQAIYTGQLDLAEAIRVGAQPLERRSSGIVPYRMRPEGPEFLLLFNLFFEQWQFPRGAVESNENDIACARREFKEQTSLELMSLFEEARTELHYVTRYREYEIDRTIIYYLGEVDPGVVRLGHENHCEVRWENARDAWELLTETSPEQLPALDAALEFLGVVINE